MTTPLGDHRFIEPHTMVEGRGMRIYTTGEVPLIPVRFELQPATYPEDGSLGEGDAALQLLFGRRHVAKHMHHLNNVTREVLTINVWERLQQAGYPVPEAWGGLFDIQVHPVFNELRQKVQWWKAVMAMVIQLKYKVPLYIQEGLVQVTTMVLEEAVVRHPEEGFYSHIPFQYDDLFSTVFGGAGGVVWDTFAIGDLEMSMASITIQTQVDREVDDGYASTDGMITDEDMAMEED